MSERIATEFDHFIGRTFTATAKPYSLEFDFKGTKKTISGMSYIENEEDPTLVEMLAAAQSKGVQLRVWLPTTLGTSDVKMNRLNVHVAETEPLPDAKVTIEPTTVTFKITAVGFG